MDAETMLEYKWGFDYFTTRWSAFYFTILIDFGHEPVIGIGFYRWFVSFGKQIDAGRFRGTVAASK